MYENSRKIIEPRIKRDGSKADEALRCFSQSLSLYQLQRNTPYTRIKGKAATRTGVGEGWPNSVARLLSACWVAL